MKGYRNIIDNTTFDKAQADLEDGQIAAVFAIDQRAPAVFDDALTGGQEPNVQERHGQGRRERRSASRK